MIVIPATQAGLAKRIECGGKGFECQLLPVIRISGADRTGHHHESCADCVIQIDGFLQILGFKIRSIIVRRSALYAEVVQQFAHILCLIWGPAIVGREELDYLIAHGRHFLDGAHRVRCECGPDGVKFQSDRYLLSLGGSHRYRGRCGSGSSGT